MSYDISVIHPDTKEVLCFEEPHQIKGGTYAMGGTTEAWLSITWNYATHFYRTMGEKGIRILYGLTGKQAIPILESAIAQLGDDIDDDYWKPTEGNAKRALEGLLVFAQLLPNGIFEGD
jgi:hypothetical protein